MKRLLIAGLLMAIPLTGCSSQMSKAEACQLLAESEAAGTSADRGGEILRELVADAPAPMDAYLKARGEWHRAPEAERDPQVDDFREAEAILAERYGFSRGVYCSG